MAANNMQICLWYDDQAEEAVNLYTSIFKDSSVGSVSRFGKEGFEHHGKPEGSVMTIDFSLNGMKFIALNGGPIFKFNEAMSIIIHCNSQEEIDHYWQSLSDGGEECPCGWLKDKFGVSWQITPANLNYYLGHSDPLKRSKALTAMFQMKKFEIALLEEAIQ